MKFTFLTWIWKCSRSPIYRGTSPCGCQVSRLLETTTTFFGSHIYGMLGSRSMFPGQLPARRSTVCFHPYGVYAFALLSLPESRELKQHIRKRIKEPTYVKGTDVCQ